jgi:hypothetical protein
VATVEMKISDLTGKQIRDEREATRLIVEHPEFTEPIGLDALAQEVIPQLQEHESQFVVITIDDPANPAAQRFVMPLEAFNNLFPEGNSTYVLERALELQRQQQRGRGRRRGGGRRQGGERSRQRVDYSSPEHAGLDHPGRISQAEREYVSTHLEAVNQRREQAGQPPLDPSNPDIAKRYGLHTDESGESGVIGDRPPL